MRFEGKVTVVGAACRTGVKHNFQQLWQMELGAISDLSSVALIVTDGDGTPHIEKALEQRDTNLSSCAWGQCGILEQ